MKYYLGCNLRAHDVAFYLLDEDRTLIFGIEEERIVYTRYHIVSTFKSLDYMLDRYGIFKKDIVAIGLTSSMAGYNELRAIHESLYGADMAERHYKFIQEEFALKYNILKAMGIPYAVIYEVPHHLAHAISGFAQSPYDSAVSFAMDGSGDQYTTACYHFTVNGYEPLMHQYRPDSLGWVWTQITRWMRLGRQGNEGKLMGLAAYGEPVYKNNFFKGFTLKDGRTLPFFDMDWKSGTFTSPIMKEFYGRTLTMDDVFGPATLYESIPNKYERDIAASLQDVTNDILLSMVSHARQKTGEKNLVLTGGVLMNSVANGVIFREAGYESIFVPPNASDNGTGLGAAIHAMNIHQDAAPNYKANCVGLPYIGPEYSDAEIESALTTFDLPFAKSANVVEETCDLLHDGKIIGWFQGRMEVGARALGNRSILANPTLSQMKDDVNKKVKFREYWRPFAPIIKKDKYLEWFVDACNDVPYMTSTHFFRESKRAAVPAVVHEDGSGRVQTCSVHDNERVYGLLDGLERRNGVPIVLNTSFNIKGMPIVCTPKDAIQCYLCTEIDVLVLGDYVVRKTAHGPNQVDVNRVSHPVKFFDDLVGKGEDVVFLVDGKSKNFTAHLDAVVREKGLRPLVLDCDAWPGLGAVDGLRYPLICVLAAFPHPYPDSKEVLLPQLRALKLIRRLTNVADEQLVLVNFNGSSWFFSQLFDERQWSLIE